jgi:hypothetical protein
MKFKLNLQPWFLPPETNETKCSTIRSLATFSHSKSCLGRRGGADCNVLSDWFWLFSLLYCLRDWNRHHYCLFHLPTRLSLLSHVENSLTTSHFGTVKGESEKQDFSPLFCNSNWVLFVCIDRISRAICTSCSCFRKQIVAGTWQNCKRSALAINTQRDFVITATLLELRRID